MQTPLNNEEIARWLSYSPADNVEKIQHMICKIHR